MKGLENETIMAKQEIGFLNFIIKPTFSLMNKFLEEKLQFTVDNIENNVLEWEKIQKNEENSS